MTTSIPFNFVFDYLPDSIIVKKMFGMHYIYLGKKIMLLLRKQDKELEFNGIWVAINKPHHENLKNNNPELRTFFIDNDGQFGNWLFLKDNAEDMEEAAIKICELITHGDSRIGRPTKKPPLE